MKDKILNLLVQYSIDVAKGDIPSENFDDLATEIDKLVSCDKYDYRYIIDYLNKATGRCGRDEFRTTDKTKQQIRARYRDGFNTEDFIKVIDNMIYHWKGKEIVHEGRTFKMDEYLRPVTLFGTKFEGYLLKTIPKTTCKPAEIE